MAAMGIPRSGKRGTSDYAVLRPVTIEDLPTLSILEKEVFSDLAYSTDQLRVFFNLFRATWYVADRDGELAGYSLVGLSSDHSDGWILGLAVGDRHRGQRLGEKLMHQALSSMMIYDVTDAHVTVRPDNAAARHVYGAFGFEQRGEAVNKYYGNGEPRDVLHRSLKENPYPIGNQSRQAPEP